MNESQSKLSRPFKSRLKKWASVSQERKHAENWVFSILDNTEKEYALGIDYTECGICKFYRAQGAFDFAKLLCPLDHFLCKLIGVKLIRTMTIAEGAEKCDFRFQKE